MIDTKARFKRLTIVYILYWISLIVIFSGIGENDVAGISLIIFILSKLAFIYYVGDIAAATKRRVWIWVLSSLLFTPIGELIVYLKLRSELVSAN
jgi:hypothetical protein